MAVRTDLRLEVVSRKDEILALAREHGAHNLSVRFPRYDFYDMPEVEFLADMDKDSSLLDRANLLGELSDLLGVQAMVFNRESLPPDFAQSLSADALILG
ncbi:MAG: hypothetical protein WEB00_15140 [Dehalococcoidia bacterium]